jgi:hypothetical protein
MTQPPIYETPVLTSRRKNSHVPVSTKTGNRMLAYTVPEPTAVREYQSVVQEHVPVYSPAAPHYYFPFPGFGPLPTSPCCGPSVEWHIPCGFPLPRLHQPCAAVLCAPQCPPYAPERVSAVAPRGCGQCGRCCLNSECRFYWGATHKQHTDRMLQEEVFVPKLGLF